MNFVGRDEGLFEVLPHYVVELRVRDCHEELGCQLRYRSNHHLERPIVIHYQLSVVDNLGIKLGQVSGVSGDTVVK